MVNSCKSLKQPTNVNPEWKKGTKETLAQQKKNQSPTLKSGDSDVNDNDINPLQLSFTCHQPNAEITISFQKASW